MADTHPVKDLVRHPYAWPGGYPRFAVCHDGEPLCAKCVKDNAKLVIRSTRDHDRSGWDVAAVEINWEDTDLVCANCNKPVESAYGEDSTTVTP